MPASRSTNCSFAVNVVEANHDELIQRMQSEGANSPADVFITVDAGRLAAGEQSCSAADQVVGAGRADSGASARSGRSMVRAGQARRVLVVRQGPGRPRRAQHLRGSGGPEVKGKVVVRSSTNVYNLSLVGSILAADGAEKTEAWCDGPGRQHGTPAEGGDTDQLKAVAAGVGDVAISNTYYLARLKASEKPEEQAIGEQLGGLFPEPGRPRHPCQRRRAPACSNPRRTRTTRSS